MVFDGCYHVANMCLEPWPVEPWKQAWNLEAITSDRTSVFFKNSSLFRQFEWTYESSNIRLKQLNFLMILIFLLNNLFYCSSLRLSQRKKVDNQKDINSNFRNINLNRRRFERFFYFAHSCLCALPVKKLKENSKRKEGKKKN